MDNTYRNGLGDLFISEQKLEADREKMQILAQIANKPAGGGNPIVYIIPLAGILVMGVLIAIKMKKKR